MDICGHPHVPAALSSQKKHPVPAEQEVDWASAAVSSLMGKTSKPALGPTQTLIQPVPAFFTG